MISSLWVVMQFPVIVLIGLLPLTALAVPVEVSTSSIAVARSSVEQGETGLSYTESFASSSSDTGAKAQDYIGNPFFDGQIESSSSTSVGSISSSGLSSLAPNSAPAESLGSGNAAAPSGPVDVSSSHGVDVVENANLNSNGNMNIGCFGNQFAGANSNANSQDLGISEVQGSEAAASAVQNQNQGSDENHGTEDLSGRHLYYGQGGPVIHVLTAGNANKVEVSGNNQGSGSTNAPSAPSDLVLVENKVPQGLGNSGLPLVGQNQQIISLGTSPLIAANANPLPGTLIALTNGGVNGVAYPVAFYILSNGGIGGLYQNAINQNSSSNSSSSSSHSESQNSSSSNSNISSYNLGTVL